MDQDDEHIDRHAVGELRMIMGEDFPMLIQTFVKDSALRIDALQQGVAAADAAAIRRSAHSFKGSASNMGAPRLARLCRAMEELGRQSETAGSEALLREIEAEYVLVRAELESL